MQPGASAGRDGKLWFTTIEGLIQYEPSLGTGRNPSPPVLIEDVTVGGEQAKLPLIGGLGPGKENLAFRYTGLSFLAPESMTFKYRLDGYDRDWTDAGTRREAFYTNLPAGNFQFHVTACAPFVPCNETGNTVAFEIVPYVYQRPWFWPLIVAFFSLLIWLAHRLRVGRLESEFAIVVAERTRIARELHDTLIQGSSGITMQMQALAERLIPSKDRHFLEDIIRDAGSCLNETRQSVAGLRDGEEVTPELADAIANMAREIAEEYKVELVMNLDETPRKILAGVRYNLVRIAQEAILNAAKHSGKAVINVSLSYAKEGLRLSISDHGTGMRDSVASTDSHHYGIIGMRERAEHIGAELEIVSTPGAGTSIIVRISGTGKITPALQREKMGTVS